MKKLKVINIFGGPGAGKSTTRAKLFGLMKQNHMSVQEVTQFAKVLTWKKDFKTLQDQLFITGTQNHSQFTLIDQVQWCLTDSPLLLGLIYRKDTYLPKSYDLLIKQVWDLYQNINFIIPRKQVYNPVGRNQNEQQAKEIDKSIELLLRSNNVPFTYITSNRNAHTQIYTHLINNTYAK